MKHLSVIVPVYNVRNYLQRCLDSLIDQTYHDFEIIIVNDGSTDDSLAICEHYRDDHPGLIKVFNKPNGGLADARNYGIKKADGAYLAFIDSDDWVDIEMFATMMAKAEATGADIVVCDMEYVDDNGRQRFSSGGDFALADIDERPELAFINNSACNKVYRRQLFDRITFPTGMWYEDLGTVPKLILISKRIAKVDKPFYKYFQRKGSIVHSADKRIFDIYAAIADVEVFIRNNVPEERRVILEKAIERLYIVDGAELTVLRIRDFDRDRLYYLRLNGEMLDRYYPQWRHSRLFNEYGFKKRLVFYFMRHGYYRILLWMFDFWGAERRIQDEGED